jgi:hypothetical protein
VLKYIKFKNPDALLTFRVTNMKKKLIERKKLRSSRFVAAAAITLLVFLIGYMASAQINKLKLDNLEYLEQDLRIDSLSSELLLTMVQKDLCKSINITSYNEELSTYGKRITYLESLYGFSSDEVTRLKNYYSLLEIRHWILARDLNEKCDANKTLVIYFYTNYGCEDCEDQGLVLTNIHRKYPFFNIYSFEYNLNNSAVDFLKATYDIPPYRLPALIVDDEVFYGFQSKEKLMEVMELERKLSEDKFSHPENYD